MDIRRLLQKKNIVNKGTPKLPAPLLENYTQHFDITYTHQSTAMEGNTISLVETKALLEDGISIGGKTLREVYEVVNHNKAYQYIKKAIVEGMALNEKMVKDIHEILMENIMQGGVYRSTDVYIMGAQHMPPTPNEMFNQVKNFYADLLWKSKELNQIELAAWTHAEFVKIHPFIDGNGRTSRLIMNYQLMSGGFLPVSISIENRIEYFNALEEYANNNNLGPFAEMIAALEEKQLDTYINAIEQINHDKQKTRDLER